MTDEAPREKPVPTTHHPRGSHVLDTRTGRTGVVMEDLGTALALRPIGGGREWYAAVEDVRPADDADVLRARVADLNSKSRKRPN